MIIEEMMMDDEEFRIKFIEVSEKIEKYKNKYKKLMQIRKKILAKYWNSKRKKNEPAYTE